MKRTLLLFWLVWLCAPVWSQTKLIDAYQYWFDNNFSQRTHVSVNPVSDLNLALDIPVQGLQEGMQHTLHIRFRDNTGLWSAIQSKLLSNAGAAITGYEYWFDDALEQRQQSTVSPVDTFKLQASLPVANLNKSMHHTLFFRAVDARGNYSSVQSQLIWDPGHTLSTYEYWFDEKTQAVVSGNMAGDTTETWAMTMNLDELPRFDRMHLRFQSASGLWSGAMLIDAPPPEAKFFTLKDRFFVTFNNTSRLGNSFHWQFGDGAESTHVNPSHTFEGPGEYGVRLIAKNEAGADTLLQYVSIKGIQAVMPEKAGNAGLATISILGGGLTDQTRVSLQLAGHADIQPDTVYLALPGKLNARFQLAGKPLGSWDVVVEIPADTTMTVPQGLRIEEAMPVEFWADISGRDVVLINRWQTYTVNYGNLGNNDIYVAPLWLLVSDIEGLELEFVSRKIDVPLRTDDLWEAIRDSVPPWFPIDSLGDRPFSARVYPLFIPLIQAGETGSFTFRVKSPSPYRLVSWVNPDWLIDTKSSDFDSCVRWAQLTALANGLVSLLASQIPGAGCVSAISMGLITFDYNEGSIGSAVYALTRAAIDCVWDLGREIPIIKAYSLTKEILSLAANIYDNYEANEACKRKFKPDKQKEKPVAVVASFDPNEVVGPGGFADKNYNFDNIAYPYKIYFENKDDATAPAQEVFVYDTLDLTRYDLRTFYFGNMGFGDSVVYIEPGLQAITMDKDMRPVKDIILRINAVLDTLSGVAFWSFVSLDPQTMDLTEDPFGGFLPPNVNSPEGEGYVSFTVMLKEGLPHATTIENQATIVFDLNKPISTNVWINAIDREPPSSRVQELSEETAGRRFMLSWDGTDAHSGVADYSVFYSKNGADPVLWKLNTRHKTDLFEGEVGSIYRFYSLATDSIGNQEVFNGVYHATTRVITSVNTLDALVNRFEVYPNPVHDVLFVDISTTEPIHLRFSMIDVFGRQVMTKTYELLPGQDVKLPVNTKGFSAGVYFCVLQTPQGRLVKKVVVGE